MGRIWSVRSFCAALWSSRKIKLPYNKNYAASEYELAMHYNYNNFLMIVDQGSYRLRSELLSLIVFSLLTTRCPLR